jgi:VRR-NUC domain
LSARYKNHFKQANNPSCRNWWGGGKIRARDIGAWGGNRIKRSVGNREGRYDKKFVRWCDRHDLLCVRTVDLFWLFEHYSNGFCSSLSVSKLRKRWRRDMNDIRELQASRAEKDELRKSWGLGPWNIYLRKRKAYFAEQSARYKRALKYWTECGQQARRSFHQCARYSNRQADSHPDYLVAVRDKRGRLMHFGFVEVKGPRESLRPSQRRFFPELVRRAGQNVWVARAPAHGSRIKFGQFAATGEVLPCGPCI